MRQPLEETVKGADDGPLRLSGFTMSFPRLHWQTAARVVRTIGFEHVDLVVGNPFGPATEESWYLPPERLLAAPVAEGERVRAFLSSLGMRCANVQVFLPTQLNTPDRAARDALLVDFEHVARFCAAAGAPTLLYVPGWTNRELGRERSYALTVAGVTRVEEILARRNVRSALEPHWATDAGQPDSALRLLEDVPGLGYTIDYSHWAYKGRSLDVVTPLLPRATHFHLRQAAPGRLQTRLEEGTIDHEEVFRRARASGYKGVYCIEYLHDKNLGLDRVDVMTEVLKMKELAQRVAEQVAG